MGYTYVMLCCDKSYYVGSTANVLQRLKTHQLGKVKYTKSRLPVELIFVKEFMTFAEARQFEIKVKSWKKRKSIEKMIAKSDNTASRYCRVV